MSGSGKTTLAEALRRRVAPACPGLVVLDGDVVRATFGGDLGYKEADRVVQVTRVQRFAKLLADQDLVVLVAVVYSNPHLLAWNRHNLPGYFEVYMKASIETVSDRDIKELYAGALRGEISDVVGVDILWQEPTAPDLVIDGDHPGDPEELSLRVLRAVPGLSHIEFGS